MKRTELLLSGMSVAFFALYLMGVVGMSLFLMLILSLFGALYAYAGFAHLNGIRLADVFKRTAYSTLRFKDFLIAILGGFGIAALINCILFSIMLWPGRWFLFLLGGVLIVVVMLLVILLKVRSELSKRLFLRGSIFLFAGMLFIILPAETWFAIRYRSQPDYVEAMVRNYKNPSPENAAELERVTEQMLIRAYEERGR